MAPEERRPLQTWHLPQNKAVDVVRWLPNPAITCDRLLVAALWNPDTATTSIDLSALCQNEETMDEDWETASSPWLECQASWTQDSRLSTLETAPLRLEQALVAAGSVTGSVSFVVVDPLRPSSSSHQSHVCPGLHDGMVSGIDLQVNTQDCVSVGDDGKINLLRFEQAVLHPKCISDNKGVMPFSAVRWASQMEFVTAGMGSSLQWWDHRRPGGPVSQTPEKWACLGAANFVHSIDVHPSRKHLCVVGGSAGSVFAWDLRWQQEPIQLAGVSLGRKGQFVGASIVESEVWEVKYDLLIPAVGQDTNLGKVPPVMICSEDGVLAVLEGGMALELLAEPCAINTFDMDPEHGKEVENRVLMFVQSEKARHKDVCPNLGNFIALLTVCTSKETSWEMVVRPLISEQLDRSVIWVCKMHPHAVKRLKVKPQCGGVDDELIKSCWDGHKVGLRLAVFFSGFLHIVARPPHVPLQKVTGAYDALYGMASLSMKSRIREFSKKVLAIDSWPAFFQGIGLQIPSKEYMTGMVRQSWQNSLKKGYHKNDTNFSNIQRHGVSKILLKGETSHLGMNSMVVMHEKWRFPTGIQYLDASCLVYDFNNRFIGVVDFMSIIGIPGIIHSGDLIDYSSGQGTHTIRISLSRLAQTDAKEMYFTMSGWRGVKLRDIRLPFVQLLEEETATDLCEYHLEDKQLGDCTSVIMCRIYRNDQSSSASWYVQAIGQLGYGSADEYGPIKRVIEESRKVKIQVV